MMVRGTSVNKTVGLALDWFDCFLDSLLQYQSFTGLLKRAFGRSTRSVQKATFRDLKDPMVLDVCQTCEMYQVLAATLTQLKMEIFAGKLL